MRVWCALVMPTPQVSCVPCSISGSTHPLALCHSRQQGTSSCLVQRHVSVKGCQVELSAQGTCSEVAVEVAVGLWQQRGEDVERHLQPVDASS
jgi:hypothetical protein